MSDPSTSLPHLRLRIADLPARKRSHFSMAPGAEERAALAAALGISGIRKLSFSGSLAPQGKSDWRLEADLGATVVQPCVVTLEPVTSRIDETVTRTYVARYDIPEGAEVEMPEDDETDPLPAELDLGEVLAEALALALPPYPRASGAETGNAVFAEPGVAPLTDEDVKPFAGLAGLRDALKNKGDDNT